MNKTKIIASLIIAISLTGNIYYLGKQIEKQIENEYEAKFIQQGREEMFSAILLQIKNTGQVRLSIPLDDGELGTLILAPVSGEEKQ